MKRLRFGIETKGGIIKLLKKSNLSLRALDIKLNTGSKTILMHCKELEFLGIIKLEHYNKNPKNGRPYTIVKLTEYGKKLKI